MALPCEIPPQVGFFLNRKTWRVSKADATNKIRLINDPPKLGRFFGESLDFFYLIFFGQLLPKKSLKLVWVINGL